MSYKDFQKARWNSLAREFGDTNPLKAVISNDNDQANYYFDKITKRMLERSLPLSKKVILDMGCGVGRLSLWMARKAQHVTGVDISEEMIRVSRSAAASQGLHNAAFHLYDGTTPPFGDASFDIIVCSGVLKYVTNDEDFRKIIEEMCRTVMRGGLIAVIDQFDYAGPVNLGEEDLGGLSVLRRPTDYISLFEMHGMKMVEQCSMYRKRFSHLGGRVLTKLPLGRFIAARPEVARAMATVDVWVDEVLRHSVAPMRGFQLLKFLRRS